MNLLSRNIRNYKNNINSMNLDKKNSFNIIWNYNRKDIGNEKIIIPELYSTLT